MQRTRTASLCSPLTPTVRCASEEGLVSYLGPCRSSQGSCVSTPEREPRLQRTAHTQTIHPPRQRHHSARTAPHHFAPGRLVLAHLARTRSHASSCLTSPGAERRLCRPRLGLRVFPPTGGIEMPRFTAHRLRGTPPSSTSPANAARASVARLRARPRSGESAASTRTSNPACSGLAQLRCARH